MLESDLTHAAMRLAYAAHHGQLDKAGVPYIFHPYHLAEQMPDHRLRCTSARCLGGYLRNLRGIGSHVSASDHGSGVSLDKDARYGLLGLYSRIALSSRSADGKTSRPIPQRGCI